MRLIDGDALKERVDNLDSKLYSPILFEEMVKIPPTIEAEPVKHGRWKRLSSFWLECSCCGDTSENPYNYCPECGARMDGVDE